MEISTLSALIITAVLLMFVGVLSLYKPDIVGADFYWAKYKGYYIPKYKKATNKYYEKQIKILGVGLIASAVILLVLSIAYAIYPPVLLIFQYSR